MGWSCAECANLDRTRRQWDENHYCYRYGCSKDGGDGFICFWCRMDSQLKEGGCGSFTNSKCEQLSFF